MERRKHVAFTGIISVCLIAFLEISSFFTLWSIDRAKPRLTSLAKERIDIAAGQVTVPRKYNDNKEVVHPYLGYVGDVDGNSNRQRSNLLPFNNYGFYDHSDQLPKRGQDRLIVGIVGGSVALGVWDAAQEMISSHLNKIPAYQDRKIIYRCLALGGYKQPQQLMAVNYVLALGGEFDIIINIDGFNEVALHLPENGPKGVFPGFPRNWWLRITPLVGKGAPHLLSEIVFLDVKRQRMAQHYRMLPNYSFFINLLWRVRDNDHRTRRYQLTGELRDYAPDPSPYVATGPRTAAGMVDDVYIELAAIWQRCSLQLHRICRANSIHYFHFLQPNQYVTGSKPMSVEERAVAIAENQEYKPGAVAGYPHLIQAGRELLSNGVAYHDLTMIFSKIKEPLYIDNCCHLGDAGNALLGESIGSRIREALTVSSMN